MGAVRNMEEDGSVTWLEPSRSSSRGFLAARCMSMGGETALGEARSARGAVDGKGHGWSEMAWGMSREESDCRPARATRKGVAQAPAGVVDFFRGPVFSSGDGRRLVIKATRRRKEWNDGDRESGAS
ncbi:uncharacterized protein A4U43_C09F8280 [Asparagus officinalis]|uniref:Uncharacterized protein n=1 Tax=Asparagus officinalis TaxID=4686 RepID=A0A5P1E9E2_ASPOF|nr:uncharacterized protein A4U43_C09F8280 [Asparagus officinalis]